MITVAEHTYEETLLPEKANILDLGCRGFLFHDELTRHGYNVYPVDIDDLHGRYYHVAISDFDGYVSIERSNDPQGTRINKKITVEPTPEDTPSKSVQCFTLKSFSDVLGVTFWDLIKIDIEGSEYEVIMALTEPPAKQLSIEFHLHTKIYGEEQVREMEDKLVSLGYYPAQHDKTSEHGCGLNYWDSLWILK